MRNEQLELKNTPVIASEAKRLAKQSITVLFYLLLLLFSLNFISCDGESFSDELEDDFSTVYTYYSQNPDVYADFSLVSLSYKIGTELSSLPSVANEIFFNLNPGYSIDGWNYYENPSNGSTELPNNITVGEDDGFVKSVQVTSAPASFYVFNWTPITYSVLFNGNGGETDSGKTEQVQENFTYDKAQKLNENPFSRLGHYFNGWNSHADGSGTPYADGSEVINLANRQDDVVTLYAQWLLNGITISFDSNGGKGSMDSIEANIDKTSLPTNNFTPPDGHHFNGWTQTPFGDFGYDGSVYLYYDGEALTANNWPNADVTLYAYWEPNPYTVTFNANGGTGSMNGQTFYYGTAQHLDRNDFSRYGYDFVEWNTKADGSVTSYSNEQTLSLTDNLTLYAQWSPQTFTVTFDANGGTGTTVTQTFKYDELPKNLKTLAECGFTAPEGQYFSGQWSDSNGFPYSDGEVISSTKWGEMYNPNGLSLYASWDFYTYTLTFDSNGGSSISPQPVNWGSYATEPNAPTRANYQFAGWYSDSALTTAFDFDSTQIKQNYTLYAKWIPVYTVTFETNGGTSVDSQSVVEGNTATRPTDPTKTGYTFKNWYANSACSDGDEFNFSEAITSDTTIYADWRVESLTVTFNANNGSGTMSNFSATYDTLPQSFAANTSISRTGYTFLGWATSSLASEAEFADGYTVTTANWSEIRTSASVTLFAVWKPNVYIVSFYTDGGTSIPSQSVEYDTTATRPAAPTRTGYIFKGWYKEASFATPFNFSSVITGDTTIYAKWEAETYTVTFNANGGTGAMTAQTFTYGESKTLTANAFEKSGYNFAGWSTSATATSTTYSNNQNISITEDMTLYAVWTQRATVTDPDIPYEIDKENEQIIFTIPEEYEYISYMWFVDFPTVTTAKLSGADAKTLTLNYSDYADGRTHSVLFWGTTSERTTKSQSATFKIERKN